MSLFGEITARLQAAGDKSYQDIMNERAASARAGRAGDLTSQIASQIREGNFDPMRSAAMMEMMAVAPERASQVFENYNNLSTARKQDMFNRALRVDALLERNPEMAIREMNAQIEQGERGGRDMSDTRMVRDMAVAGDIAGAKQQIRDFMDVGYATGMLKPPPKTAEERERERQIEMEKMDIRRAELGERVRENLEAERRLSPSQEKVLNDAQDTYLKAGKEARRLDVLAEDIAKNAGQMQGGLAGDWQEFYKTISGEEDAISNLRREYRDLRASKAMQNLPPGTASDADVALALSGFPPDTANADYLSSFVRGLGKMSKAAENYNYFKSIYITRKRNTRGMLEAWNKRYKSDALNKEVTMNDIAETAINRGMSIEEVMRLLDIEDG